MVWLIKPVEMGAGTGYEPVELRGHGPGPAAGKKRLQQESCR
jgi:hypothetical protein